MGLDFQKRVVGFDAASTESLKHEFALPAKPVAIRSKADLRVRDARSMSASAGTEPCKSGGVVAHHVFAAASNRREGVSACI